MEDTRAKLKTAIGKGIFATFAVLILGFGVMMTFWMIMKNDYPSLPGLFYYRAATLGDGICLPLLVGALMTYIILAEGKIHKPRRVEIFVSAFLGVIAIGMQASWLISNNTKLNWTIPRLHYFNAAGWYHAVFFVVMFALLGFLFTRFIYVKKLESLKIRNAENVNCNDDEIFRIIFQAVMWFSGAFFLFLFSIDDYARDKNYFVIFTIVLILVLAFSTTIYLISNKTIINKRISKKANDNKESINKRIDDEIINNKDIINKKLKDDMAPIICGAFSAFALAHIIYGGINANYAYLISCACLIVVLVVPDEKRKKQMALYYFLIAVPTLLLEIAIASQTLLAYSLIISVISICVPCAVAVCQQDTSRYNVLRKAVFAAVTILFTVSILLIIFREGGWR